MCPQRRSISVHRICGHAFGSVTTHAVPRSRFMIAALLVVAIVLGGQEARATSLFGHFGLHHSLPTFCAQWTGRQRQLCEGYISAAGDDKFTAAVTWRNADRKTYECSGIQAECLHDDISNNIAGTSCEPMTESAECEFGTCQSGVCLGFKTKQQQGKIQQQEQHETADKRDDDDEGLHQPLQRMLAETAHHSSKKLLTVKSVEAAKAATAAKAVKAEKSLYSSMSQSAILNMLKKGPNPTWQTATATINTGQTYTRVPDSFLATSHAWSRIHDYADDRMAHSWAAVFNTLSPNPVIRVGGADQDRMSQLPAQITWDALKKLRRYTNARFVIGLPLWPKNSIDLSKQIMAAANKNLGSSVIVFELGNEPEFWPSGLGGWSKDGKWKKGVDAYLEWFDRVARAINPCNSGKMLSGPGWGNLNTQPTKWTASVLYKGKDCYLKEMNIHYYPYINNETVTARELLSQPLQDFAIQQYKDIQRIVTDKEKIGIRISETNSLYGGGRPDLSDTLVGALWVSDALFAFSLAGAKAFHLHWGIGGDPSGTLGQPNTGVQTNFHFDVKPGEGPVPYPSIHAPWYGYLLWTVAATGGIGRAADATFVPATIDNKGKCGANMKVWALKADNGQLRVVLINKDELINCNLRVNIPANYCKKPAVLTRMLPNNDGIYSKRGIYFQGQSYEGAGYSGQLQGKYESFNLSPQKFKDGKCGYTVPVPAASAAIVLAR